MQKKAQSCTKKGKRFKKTREKKNCTAVKNQHPQRGRCGHPFPSLLKLYLIYLQLYYQSTNQDIPIWLLKLQFDQKFNCVFKTRSESCVLSTAFHCILHCIYFYLILMSVSLFQRNYTNRPKWALLVQKGMIKEKVNSCAKSKRTLQNCNNSPKVH